MAPRTGASCEEKILEPDSLQFELQWTKRKLDSLNEKVSEFEGMVEVIMDHFGNNLVGDMWTQEDMILLRDVKRQLEEMDG
jgi:hypothetical protein